MYSRGTTSREFRTSLVVLGNSRGDHGSNNHTGPIGSDDVTQPYRSLRRREDCVRICLVNDLRKPVLFRLELRCGKQAPSIWMTRRPASEGNQLRERTIQVRVSAVRTMWAVVKRMVAGIERISPTGSRAMICSLLPIVLHTSN